MIGTDNKRYKCKRCGKIQPNGGGIACPKCGSVQIKRVRQHET